jgi:two-component sensor histidine kinase
MMEDLFVLQAFLGSMAATTLLLGAAAGERRRTVQQLEESNRRLGESLREKETLLREIHHRVKNNLQIVYSLVNLQSTHVQDPRTLAGLQDCRERVRTMALIHEKLYGSRDLDRIDFADYVQDLARDLLRTYGAAGRVRLSVEAERIPFDIQEAVPCGLIVYELVSNALKHAFPQGREGEIRVSLRRAVDGPVALSVSDNGVGLPPDLDVANTRSLGLHLVHNLARQAGGEVRVTRDGGTSFQLILGRTPAPAGAGSLTADAPSPNMGA